MLFTLLCVTLFHPHSTLLFTNVQVARRGSIDRCDQSSQGSGSPLHSPRDNAMEKAEAMSEFHSFLHSKVSL